MNKEELLNLPMVVCAECGWEIIRSIWNAPMCDDCAMNKDMEQQLEREGK
jgi:lipopolysaccharide biosynthesis regulator YciM